MAAGLGNNRKAIYAGGMLVAFGVLSNKWFLEGLGANSIDRKGALLIGVLQAMLIVLGIVILVRRPSLEHPTKGEFFLLVASLLVTLGIGEIGARYWLNRLAPPEQAILYKSHIGYARPIVSPHHYLIYYTTPNFKRGLTFHNALGYRNAEFSVRKPVGTFRIVTLGGSTTYTAAVEDNRKTFPTQLERLLREKYGHASVQVINAGVGGYNSWESLINLEFRVLDLDPDLVIVYHGTNDVHARFVDPATYRGDNAGRRQRWITPRLAIWERSTLLRILSRKLGVTGQVGLRDFIAPASAISPTSETFSTEARMELLRQNPPIYFERNLRNMIAISKEHGVKILLATWAYNPLFEDYASTEYYQQGFTESNEIVRKVAEQHDVPLLDFSSIMPADQRYWADGRHVNEEGALLKAELFARFIDEQQLVPR